MIEKHLVVCLLLVVTLQSSLSEHGGPPPFFKSILESPAKDKCLKESGLDSLDDLMTEKHSAKAACFSFCLAKGEGYIDDKGKIATEKFEVDEFKSHVPKEIMEGLIGCMKGITVNGCSDMEKMRNCFKPT